MSEPPARRFGRGRAVKETTTAPLPTSRFDKLSNHAEPEVFPPKRKTKPFDDARKDIQLSSNYVPIYFDDCQLFVYSVEYNPPVDSPQMKSRLLQQKRELFPEPFIYDGNVIYSREQFRNEKYEFDLTLPNSSSKIACLIRFSKTSVLSDSIALLNIIFRKILRLMNLKLVGRNYYSPELGIQLPKYGIHVWPGYVSAIKKHESGSLLMLDVHHKMIRMDTVLDLMSYLFNSCGGKSFTAACFKAIVGQTVITRYNNKTYRIDDISWDKNPTDTFEWDTRTITFIDYYKEMYGKTIADPKQPLLVHRMKESKPASSFAGPKNTSDSDRTIQLIPELCYLTGLDDKLRDDFTAMRDIARYIHSGPEERFTSISKFVKSLNSNSEVLAELGKWGIKLGSELLSTKGTYLAPETLITNQGRQQFETNPQTGWGTQIGKQRLLYCVTLTQWVCIYTSKDKMIVNRFVNTLISSGSNMGMNISMPQYKELPSDNIKGYLDSMKNCITKSLQLVMTIFPTRREDRYTAVKRLCYCDMPVPSQVIITRTVANPKKVGSVCQRVAMQMNCKLGGELWTVPIPYKSIMAIGLDVSHCTPNGKNLSVIGFVSSMSSTFTKWYTSVKFQSSGIEIISCIEQCLCKALQVFVQHNGALPEKIVVFRDGVSDGQIKAVKQFELESFISGFKNFKENYNPELIFVIIKKKINSRIFTKGNDARSIVNPLPGTIIDSVITGEKGREPSFFLISQHFSQGTIQPSCLSVLYNESELSLKEIQRLCYKCTYLYYNWPGTIKCPAPCQYAHRAAFMAGQTLNKEAHQSLADRLYYL